MPADKRLSAALSATEDVTDSLDSIAESALGAATNFEYLDESAESAADSLDDVADEADDAGSSLSGISDNAATAAASLEASEQAADEAGDEFTETTAEAAGLSAALAGVSGMSVGTMSAGVDVPDDVDAPAMPDGGVMDIGASMPDTSGLDFGGDQSLNLNVDGTDELTAMGGAGHIAAEGLDAFESSSISAATSSALAASRADETGDSLWGAVPGGEAMSGALDSVRNSAMGAIPGLRGAGNAADEAGDEMSEAAAESVALSGALKTTDSAASGLGTEMFGLHGSLGSVAAVAGPLIATLGALVGPLGAVGAAAGGAGASLAGLFGAGLMAEAESMVGTTAEVGGEMTELENKGDAVEAIFDNVKDRAGEMLAPLQTAETATFFQNVLDTGLTVFQDFVTMTERLMGPLFDMTDRLGEAFAMEEPRFFAELEATTESMLGPLGDLGIWLLGAIPDGLKWVREEGLALIPVISSFALSTLDLAVGLAEAGAAIWNVIGPALGFLFDTATGVLGVFNSLPQPIQNAGVVAGIAAGGMYLLGGALSGVTLSAISLSAVLGAISWPIVAVGALAGAAYLLADHFGLIQPIVNAVGATFNWFGGVLASTWNTAIGLTEGFINTLFGIYDVLGPLGPLLMPGIAAVKGLMWAFNNLGGIVDWVGGKFAGLMSWLGKGWQKTTKFIGGLIDDVAKWFEGMINDAIGVLNSMIDTANKIPGVNIKTTLEPVDLGEVGSGGSGGGVDLSWAQTGGGGGGGSSGGEGGGSGSGGQSPPPAGGGQSPPPASAGGGSTSVYQDNREVTVDARGSDMSEGEIESVVERALDKDNRRNQRNRKRNYPST
ncbi:hypothetical protein [Halococcus saccharolyticus]|uniref:Uncharacterized protein n=1 Tax=Halococcus saccharolyticus DSM 5350 TaxID=1227455 RepID=M0MRM2_9EURY|nr:hypothetical protein [Halococcus saccharolyticus]EMA47993.1 hypothetical protein C449_00935 [Halococcus saccharolyticus DSM 5350]